MIGFEQSEGVGFLMIRRPEAANAFTSDMLRQTAEIVEIIRESCDLLIISSEGADFSLGRDREEPKHPESPRAAFSEIARVNAAFAAYPGIVITAVKGRAFGFGLGIAMRSDIALATDDALFMLDEVSLGFPPMFLMEVVLDHLPPKRALDLILTSRSFDAEDALEMGLVSRIVAAGDMDQTVDDYVSTLRGRDPNVLRECKQYLAAIRKLPLDARPAFALDEQTRFALENH
ncbi:MAG: enoyl-CoA hydratase/isomerase family protein [Proteobacteria bacterium]|nr:enoyl-CoA hydratase/isomerase family protein [Pseudomonadota bacterium]MDA1325915.1 enoyl-CoA hydratase/isomerase family protein [Pseudomonadota bacterium]